MYDAFLALGRLFVMISDSFGGQFDTFWSFIFLVEYM